MRVLVVANIDIGLYKFRKELLQRLIDNGNEVYISLPNGDLVEPLTELGCNFIDTPVDRRGVNPVKDIKLLLRYFKIINQVKPDLVITYTIKPNVYAGLICRLKKIPYAINITGLGTTFQNDGILKNLLRLCIKFLQKMQKLCFLKILKI